MPRLNVILLDKLDEDTYRYVLWADVPVARQSFYADTNKSSVWKDATAQDDANLQGGSVVEKLDSVHMPHNHTLVQLETELQTRWGFYQSSVTANNPWSVYGTQWNGALWSVAGVV